MRIGIMSLHRIENYGLFLQAYALKKVIEHLGHTVVFVDYETGVPINLDERLTKTPELNDKIFRLKCMVRRFFGMPMCSTYVYKENLRKLGVTERRRYNEVVDVLVVGSDEVFNCLQTNPDVGYSLELFGKNNNAKKLLSYSASFGETNAENLKESGKYNEIREHLKDFDAISLCDNDSLSTVREMSIERAQIHINPVFLYDFDKEVKVNSEYSDYILIYSGANRINSPEIITAIKDYARANGKKTLSVGYHQTWTDIKVSGDAFSMLGYIRNASCVITDSYHGTALAIKEKKKFVTLLSERNRHKVVTMLEKFNLAGRCAENTKALKNLLQSEVDYEKTDFVIKTEKKKAIEYLIGNFTE